MAYLVWTVGTSAEVFYLRQRHAIGRAPHNDLQVLDPQVSVDHCYLEKVAEGWLLCDSGSMNGTWVNGAQVSRHRLRHLDEIVVGQACFTFTDMAQAMARVAGGVSAPRPPETEPVPPAQSLVRIIAHFHAERDESGEPTAAAEQAATQDGPLARPQPSTFGALERALAARHLDELARSLLHDATNLAGGLWGAWYWAPLGPEAQPAHLVAGTRAVPERPAFDHALLLAAASASSPITHPDDQPILYRGWPATRALTIPFVRFSEVFAVAGVEVAGRIDPRACEEIALLARVGGALSSELQRRRRS